MYLPDHHPEAASARVTLVVVALGRTHRLVDCLRSLVEHESVVPFSIVCVINPVTATVDPDIAAQVDSLGVRVIEPSVNLGWVGGLHAGRQGVATEHLVWVQDDMVVLPGWLDALVAAADQHPEVGAFGSTRFDDDGVVALFNAGWCQPPDRVDAWNETDPTATELPSAVTRFDWVTSKGLLCRTAVWDEVGGPDPSLYPLTHVDKDFCVHVRAHGWPVALVPDARLRHAGNQSAPGLLRLYLAERLSARIDERWGAVVAQLPRAGGSTLAHECTRARAAEYEHWCAREAADIVVDFGRWAERRRREVDERVSSADGSGASSEPELVALRQRVAELDAGLATALQQLNAVTASRSWRVTAPLRRLFGRRTPPTGDGRPY